MEDTTYEPFSLPKIQGLKQLAEKLRVYDPDDLLATSAALQLVPDNLWRLLRLEVLTHVAASLPAKQNNPRISYRHLKSLCNAAPLGAGLIALAEDPVANLFTDTFTFHGGSFLVFPGASEEVVFIMRHLAASIFLFGKPLPNPTFTRSVNDLLAASLLVSDAVGRKAGLGRGLSPSASPPRGTVIPSRERLVRLKEAVTFSPSELEGLLADHGLSMRAIEPLIKPLGTISVEDYDMENGELFATPIIFTGDRYIVAIPSMLLLSVRDCVLALSHAHNVQAELALRYNQAVWETVIQSLHFMDNPHLPLPTPKPFAALYKPWFCDGLFKADSDKMLYTMLVTEPFESALGATLDHWNALDDAFQERMRQIQEYVFSHFTGVNDVLFVCLTQGVERVYIMSSGVSTTQGAPLMISMSASDLDTLAQVEYGDPLLLWKYAEALYRLSSQTAILAPSGELDKFDFYRKHRYSFYSSDETQPNVLIIPPGSTGQLRIEVAHERDTHAVPSYDMEHLIEVTSLFGTNGIPLYMPIVNLSGKPKNLVPCLVEGLPILVWITGPNYQSDVKVDIQLHELYAQFAATIGYWLWQLTPELHSHLQALVGKYARLHINVQLVTPENWIEPGDAVRPPDGEPVIVCSDTQHGNISILVQPQIRSLLEQPDNSAELLVMSHVLRGLRELLPSSSQETLTDVAIERILAPHRALPHKKMMVVVPLNNAPDMDAKGLPPFRAVPDADEEALLDDLGIYLASVEGLRPGYTHSEARIQLLDKVVTYFYKTLVSLVATLNPEELLERLIAQAETVVQEVAEHQVMMPTRMACFSHDPEMLDRFGKEKQDRAQAGVASRFIIEYISAKPPKGIRPMSLAVYDRLLALSSLIVNYGMMRSFLQYELADIKLGMLPSGRLGVDRAEWRKLLEAYTPVFAAGEVARATRSFKRHWRVANSVPSQKYNANGDKTSYSSTSPVKSVPGVSTRMSLNEVEELERVTHAEFGFTLSEFADLVAEAMNIGRDQDRAVACIPLAELTSQLAQRLNWTQERVQSILSDLSLRPRESFLEPPSPYKGKEVYPWVFNRSLSYLRKPFIIRERRGTTEVLWGVRHLYNAWEYLGNLCTNGRLKANSREMKSYLSRINHMEGERFNDKVADLYSIDPQLRLKKRVQKLSGVRLPEHLGDIDVLVADLHKRVIRLLECKNLALARTPEEMHNEYQVLFIGRDGKLSVVEKQEQRARWVREHLGEALDLLGLPNDTRWKVEPMIVVDVELMTPYLRRSSVPIVSIEQLRAQLVT
jgi:hypothetical protein